MHSLCKITEYAFNKIPCILVRTRLLQAPQNGESNISSPTMCLTFVFKCAKITCFIFVLYYSAAAWQKGLTDNFVKISGMFRVSILAHENTLVSNASLPKPQKIIVQKKVYVQINGSNYTAIGNYLETINMSVMPFYRGCAVLCNVNHLVLLSTNIVRSSETQILFILSLTINILKLGHKQGGLTPQSVDQPHTQLRPPEMTLCTGVYGELQNLAPISPLQLHPNPLPHPSFEKSTP